MTFNVTAEFAAGSVGSVTFRRRVWLNDNGALVPPEDVTADLTGSPPGFTQALRPTIESGVSPEDWSYEVIVAIEGQDDLVGSMFLTENSDLADVFQFVAAQTGEFYATKGEFSDLVNTVGNPVSLDDIDDAVTAEAVLRAADVDSEETRALTAEALLAPKDSPALTGNPTAPTQSAGNNSTRVATTAYADGAVSTETTNRVTDVNAEETRALTAEGLLDGRLDTLEAAPAGFEYVVNTDGDPGVTIYVGTVEPTDPPYDLAVGDIWIDSTPA